VDGWEKTTDYCPRQKSNPITQPVSRSLQQLKYPSSTITKEGQAELFPQAV